MESGRKRRKRRNFIENLIEVEIGISFGIDIIGN